MHDYKIIIGACFFNSGLFEEGEGGDSFLNYGFDISCCFCCIVVVIVVAGCRLSSLLSLPLLLLLLLLLAVAVVLAMTPARVQRQK